MDNQRKDDQSASQSSTLSENWTGQHSVDISSDSQPKPKPSTYYHALSKALARRVAKFCIHAAPRLYLRFPHSSRSFQLQKELNNLKKECEKFTINGEFNVILWALNLLGRLDRAANSTRQVNTLMNPTVMLRAVFETGCWDLKTEERCARARRQLRHLIEMMNDELTSSGNNSKLEQCAAEAATLLEEIGWMEIEDFDMSSKTLSWMIRWADLWISLCSHLRGLQRAHEKETSSHKQKPETKTSDSISASSTVAADPPVIQPISESAEDNTVESPHQDSDALPPPALDAQGELSPASPADADSAVISALSSTGELENSATVSPTAAEPQEDADSTSSENWIKVSWVNVSAQPESADDLHADPEPNQNPEPEILSSDQPPKETLVVRVAKFIMEATPQLLIEAPKSDEISWTEALLREKLHQLENECENSDENPILREEAKDALLGLQSKLWDDKAKLLRALSILCAVFPNDCWAFSPQYRRHHVHQELVNILRVTAQLGDHLRSCGLSRHDYIAKHIVRKVGPLIRSIHCLELNEKMSLRAQNRLLTWASDWLTLCNSMVTNSHYFESLYNSQK